MTNGALFASALDQLSEAAEAAWPTLRLDRSRFRARLAAAVPPESSDALIALSKIHANDLYLATACADGVREALNQFATRHLSHLDRYLKRFGNSSIRAEDVRRELEDTLLFGRVGAPARIGQYTGRGPLDRFVGTAAKYAALSMLRAQQRDSPADFDALASHLTSLTDPPEHPIDTRCVALVRESLRVALMALDRRKRTIVRLHLMQGVTLTQIARMLKVHQSTVSRAFDAAIEAIHAEISRRLQELEGIEPSEMRLILREVQGRIDLSLSRILRDTQGD
jgi:RNA polymerase sigma-70 factor (ECF subfamily)